ncbi:hypothetical protein GCM10027167_24530 [Nocardia heshunensis]
MPTAAAPPDRQFGLDPHRPQWEHPGPVPEFALTAPAGCAVDRWAAEAAELIQAEGGDGPLVIRAGSRHRLVVELMERPNHPPALQIAAEYPRDRASALPVLPHAATWTLPDLALLRAGAIGLEQLHPLVAAALAPNPPRTAGSHGSTEIACGTTLSIDPRVVDCRGERHRIGLRDGVLTALDHPVDEIRREELLVALSGTPLPCLQAIDRAHRHPDCLPGVRERLRHGDIAGALAVVDGLLGPGASLRAGALRDAFEAVAKRRITYGLFRAGLTGSGPRMPRKPRPPHRTHPRHAARV